MLPAAWKTTCLASSLLALAALAGCSTYQPAPDSFQTSSIAPYHLGSGDKLRITVFDQTGLTGTYNVDQSGYISFPLIGAVAARGKTVSGLEKTIAAKLRNGYVQNPDVSVQVDQYRSIYIMGEVGQPGQYSYVPGMSAQNAVAAAGGFTPRADERSVRVTRKINGSPMTGDVPVTAAIMAGDTIDVRERLF